MLAVVVAHDKPVMLGKLNLGFFARAFLVVFKGGLGSYLANMVVVTIIACCIVIATCGLGLIYMDRALLGVCYWAHAPARAPGVRTLAHPLSSLYSLDHWI